MVYSPDNTSYWLTDIVFHWVMSIFIGQGDPHWGTETALGLWVTGWNMSVGKAKSPFPSASQHSRTHQQQRVRVFLIILICCKKQTNKKNAKIINKKWDVVSGLNLMNCIMFSGTLDLYSVVHLFKMNKCINGIKSTPNHRHISNIFYKKYTNKTTAVISRW